MSTVYRAFDTVLERQVAIKLMHREIAGDSDQLERFRREARAVAQLNHPHVVGVIDAGEEERRRGRLLDAVHRLRVRRGRDAQGPHPPQRPPAGVRGGRLRDRDRARARRRARRQIVHRDVKPQNVLVDEEGAAKVTDFGIARSLAQEGLTADGRVLGTTDYVSPEQALGHAVTGQSDLYSLGIVLFEMLTGDVPFHGENQVAVAMKHVREELPDVQVRRPEVSAALAAVLDRATAKDLDRRYPDAASSSPTSRTSWRSRPRARGQVTGEATAVLRSLPGEHAPAPAAAHARARRRRSSRCSSSSRRSRVVVLAARARQTERGTGKRATARPPAGPARRSRSASARRDDYDPLGDNARAPRRDERRRRPRPALDLVDRELPTAACRRTASGIVIDAAAGRRGAASSSCARRRPASRRGLRAARPTPRHRAARRLDGGQRDPRGRRATRSSTSTPRASASATTSSGSPSCRRRASSAEISEILLFR